MRSVVLGALVASTVTLSACGDREPKPDAYWLEHPAEAQARIKKCKADITTLEQEVRTKPPEALTALARECLYLVMSGHYQRDKHRGEPMESILD